MQASRRHLCLLYQNTPMRQRLRVYSPECVEGLFSEVRRYDERRDPHKTRTRKGPGGWSRPSASRSKGFALGVGPYLAVDLRDEGLTVLVVLLELPHLLELLGGKAVDPPGDLLHAQSIVVGGSKGAKDGGPKLGLVGGLLGLAEDLVGPLGGILGYPEALARDLLGGLEALLGGLLEGPHALPSVGEGREEVRVGPDPTLGERPQALLLPAYGTREGLGRARVVLGLLAQHLYGVSRPVLDELGVLLLELQEPDAVGEELLGGPCVLLLELHELQPAFGEA